MSNAVVEEDGDEIFIPMDKVRCCRLRFEGGKPVYSKLVEVKSHGRIWMCCDKCGASYGEKPKEKKP